MSVNPIPAGFHTIAPNIIVKSVDEHGKGESSIHSAAHGRFRRTRKTFRSKKCSSVSIHSPPDARASILGSITWLTTTD
jgi:hypothetical protein